MPPKEAHKTLSARDVAVIERWITQGALYKPHWAYLPPTIIKPENTKWDSRRSMRSTATSTPGSPKEGLSPAPEADRETLINRVALDLTGLPPALEKSTRS